MYKSGSRGELCKAFARSFDSKTSIFYNTVSYRVQFSLALGGFTLNSFLKASSVILMFSMGSSRAIPSGNRR